MQLELNDIVKILNRIETLENKLATMETRLAKLENNSAAPSNRPPFPATLISDKYKGLAEYLYQKWDKKIEMHYTEIEEVLGFPLPPTAYNLPQSYWANTETHSYAKGSWLAVGYKAKVDGNNKKVIFERNLY